MLDEISIVIKSLLSYANDNNIYDNRAFGVEVIVAHDSTTAAFDATNNWWGDVGGPGADFDGDSVFGDAVSANVDYDPWLGKSLSELKDDIEALSDEDFNKEPTDRRDSLVDKIESVFDQYDDGSYRGALNKLQRDLTKRIEKWIIEGEQDALIALVDAEILILNGFVQ